MTWNELEKLIEGLPKNWEISRHERNALFRDAQSITLEAGEGRIAAFLARYEGRFKPSTKQLCYVLAHELEQAAEKTAAPPLDGGVWVEVDTQYSEREYNGKHWGRVESSAHGKPPCVAENAKAATRSAPEDECEAILGPDVHKQARMKLECPF